MEKKNLFVIPAALPTEEFIELLVEKPGLRIERIISTGQISPPDFWYDQEEVEWVTVLQGEATLQWEAGNRTLMHAGDCLLIPSHVKHRVAETSQEPPCVWLAVFIAPNSDR